MAAGTPQYYANHYADPIISERAVNESRRLKVIYLGAGISGMTAALLFQRAALNIDLTIYEKNPDIGGTWYENRYPGCACDVPAHGYQLSFESSLHWKSFFAGSDDILDYWTRLVEKYDLRKYMHFNMKCIGAQWNDETSQWLIKLENTSTGAVSEEVCDVFFQGAGALNAWKWPDIEGLHTFKNQLQHTANWDRSVDLKNKRIAIIGAGSSGIQMVAATESIVKSMDHYVRGRTWIGVPFGADMIRQRNNGGSRGNFEYTPEEIEAWKKDPESYRQYRKGIEVGLQGHFNVIHRESMEHQYAWKMFKETMEAKLSAKPGIAQHIVPEFAPFCKRLTPGPGYLEALTSDKVTVIPNGIQRIDETGIIGSDGVHRPVDVIACATGFNTSFVSRFPIIGKNGVNLQDRYAIKPETYLSLCTDGFPNMFQSLGPNAGLGHGNLIAIIEAIHDYFVAILRKLSEGNTKTIEPKRDAVLQFTKYSEAFFRRTVFSTTCNSWYKTSPPGSSAEERKRGRITALWPGSSLHACKTLSSVRWEDYEYTSTDGNDFGWIGNGWTLAERADDSDAISSAISTVTFLHDSPPASVGQKGVEGVQTNGHLHSEDNEPVKTTDGVDVPPVLQGKSTEGLRVPEGVVST